MAGITGYRSVPPLPLPPLPPMSTDGTETVIADLVNRYGQIINATGVTNVAVGGGLNFYGFCECMDMQWYPTAGLFVGIGSANNSTAVAKAGAFSTPTGAVITVVTTSLPAAWQSSTNHIGT